MKKTYLLYRVLSYGDFYVNCAVLVSGRWRIVSAPVSGLLWATRDQRSRIIEAGLKKALWNPSLKRYSYAYYKRKPF